MKVRFHTKYQNFQIEHPDLGRLRFNDSTYETDVPGEVEYLLGRFKTTPWEIWLDEGEGTVICPVCFKAVKTELALTGHMNTHKKEVAHELGGDPEPGEGEDPR